MAENERRNPIKRTLEILGGTAKDIGKDYTSNLQGLITDASMVKSSVIQGAGTVKEKFDEMKNGTGPIKGVLNWFYTKEGETDPWDLDDSDSDFDAGTDFGSGDDEDGESEGPGVLDVSEARDLTRGHVNSMLKIASKLTEAQIANTAEVVSTINSRSAEMIASVNNVNTTLIGIAKQIEMMSKVVVAVSYQQPRRKNQDSLFDYNGRLTLGTVFDASKQSLQNSTLATTGSLLGTMKSSGMLTPEMVARLGYDFFLGDKKWKGLGNKSLNEVGDRFNNIIGQGISDTLSTLMDSKIFKTIFGDLKQEKRSNDFASYTKNEYTRDPAMFDGMTRKSIVSIIPEYLRRIHEDLSGGQKISIDERGNLTTKEGHTWNKAVSKDLYGTGAMDYDDLEDFRKTVGNDKYGEYNIDQKHANTMSILLTGSLIRMMFKQNTKSFNKKWMNPNNIEFLTEISKAMDGVNGKSAKQWLPVIADMVTYISADRGRLNKFANEVNVKYESVRKKLEQDATDVFDQQNVDNISDMTAINAMRTSVLNRHKNDKVSPVPEDTPPPPVVASVTGHGDTDDEGPARWAIGDTLSDIRSLLGSIAKKTIGTKNYNKIKLSSPLNVQVDDSYDYYKEPDKNDERASDEEEEKKPKITMQSLKDSVSNGTGASLKEDIKATFSNVKGIVKASADDVVGTIKNDDGSDTSLSTAAKNAGQIVADGAKKVTNAAIAGLTAAKDKIVEVYNSDGVQDKITRVKGKAADIKEKTKENFGKLKDWSKEKAEDFVDWSKEELAELKTLAKDKMTRIADNASYKAYQGIEKASEWANNIDKEKSSQEEAEDANTVRLITSAMQLAIQNGSASQDEKTSIQNLVNSIHNNKLKSKMRKNVNTILDRSSFDMKDGEGSGKKGILGKIFGVLGLIASPIKLLGTLLRFIVPKILHGGGKLLGKVFGDDFKKLGSQFGELREELGNLRTLRRERRVEKREEKQAAKDDPNRMTLSKAIKPAMDAISKQTISLVNKGKEQVKKVADKVGTAVDKGIQKTGYGIGTAVGFTKNAIDDFKSGRKDGYTNSFMGKVGDTSKKITDKVGSIAQTGVEKAAYGIGTAVGYTKVGKLKNDNDSEFSQAMSETKDNLKQMASEKMGKLKDNFGEFAEGFKMGLKDEDEEAEVKKAEIRVDGIDEPATTFVDKALAKIIGLFTGAEKDPEKNVFEKIATKETEEGNEQSNEEGGKSEENNEGSINREEDKQNTDQQQDDQQKNTEGSIQGLNQNSDNKTSDSNSNDSVGNSTQTTDTGGGGGGTTTTASSDTGGSGGKGIGGTGGGGAEGVAGAVSGASNAIKSISTIMKIGKSVGKIAKLLSGIGATVGKIVLKAVMMLSGFKALTKTLESFIPMVTKIVSVGLKPLNKIFNLLNKIIKPIFKTVEKILKGLMDGISSILNSLMDVIVPVLNNVIMPVLNALMPVIDVLLNVLQPLFDIVSAVVDVVMIPFMGIFKHVLVPIVKQIGNITQVIMGILELGFGALMVPLGGILAGIGTVASLIPGASGKGKDLKNSGKDMMSTGWSMVTQGMKDIGSGIAAYISTVLKAVTFQDQTESEEEKENTYIENPTRDDSNSAGSPFDGYGSGDSNTWNNNNTDSHDSIMNISHIYGGGNKSQKSYGNALGMKDNGCGPVALADAYNRRHGTSVDGLSMASSMAKSGSYEPNKGTTVASFMNTSSKLGMNVKAGGVTQASLKRATPNNPVTLVGSGSDFGTKKGNTHYVNVVGTDKYGGAYVSNPLTGRVDRRSASTLAGSSVLGLYGSGDNGFTFPDAVQEAMSELKSLAGSLLGMFNGPSTSEQMESQMNAEGQKHNLDNAKDHITNLYGQEKLDEFIKEAEKSARKDFEASNPRKDGETKEEYEKRFQKWYNESRQNQYLAEASALNESLEKIRNGDDGILKSTNDFTGKLSEVEATVGSAADAAESDSTSSTGGIITGSSGFYSSKGKSKMYMPFIPEFTDTNMNDYIDQSTRMSGHSPIHQFFKHMWNVGQAWTFNSGYYSSRHEPDKFGSGTSGTANHFGVDINGTPDENGKPLHAITEGTVVTSAGGAVEGDRSANGRAGNYIAWKDNDGYLHRYLHMKSDPLKKVNEKIEAGDILGYVGNTGDSDGAHLHYDITDPYGRNVNPMMYWSWHAGTKQGEVATTDVMKKNSAWTAERANRLKNSNYHAEAQAAGLTPGQEAMIAGMAVWEDNLEKITGEKSITKVTADKYGQTAFGLMNWIPSSGNRYVGAEETMYGTTLREQLPYVYDMYFAKEPTHGRAKIINPNYGDSKNAIEGVIGKKLQLNVGDYWGPFADTDIAESMGHYVANALVPVDSYRNEAGQAKYIGTTVDAYNWMLKEGWIGI